MTWTDWTEKYRPRSLKDVVGNAKAIGELKDWADEWSTGVPKERAVILAGEPGVGKTTSAHALARDMGWGVVEMNASDSRNEEAVRRIATTGAVHAAFTASGEFKSRDEGGRQVVILDEADNLFGREDRGGMRAIIDTIRITGQPIILIVNDLYELTRRGGSLNTLARTIKFTKVHSRSIPKALRNIAVAENIELELGVAEALAERAGGDMRGAVNDLQALAYGRERIAIGDVAALGDRDKTSDVWTLLGKVFYGKGIDEQRKLAFDLDETPDMISLWIDENLPIFYTDKADLVDGYAALSRADVYLGRTIRRQQFALWSYATTMMTGGVSLANVEPAARARFAFPSWLRKQSSSRKMRAVRDSLALKVGSFTHTSKARARNDFFPMLKTLSQRDDEDAYVTWAAHEFGLDEDEVAFLLDIKPTLARVKKIIVRAGEMGERAGAREAGAFGAFGRGGAASSNDADDEPDDASDATDDADDEATASPKAAKGKPAKPAEKEDARQQKNLFDF